MKKSFIMYLAAVLCVLNACKPPETDEPGKFELNPKSVVLAQGDKYRINATYGGRTVTDGVLWKTSDSTVVTVDGNGSIIADEYNVGKATITATYKDSVAYCEVEVKPFLLTTTFTNCCLLDVDTAGCDSVYEIEAGSGGTYRCYRANATMGIFSDGFYINDEGYLDGVEQGVLVEVSAPMYYATKGLNPGQSGGIVFSLGTWGVGQEWWDADYDMAGQPGYIESEADYTNIIKTLFEAILEDDNTAASNSMKAAGALCKGTNLNIYTYSYDAETQQGGYSYSYISDAFVTRAIFQVLADEGASGNMNKLDSVSINAKQLSQDTYWGLGVDLEIDEQAGTVKLLSDKVLWEKEELVFEYISDKAAAPARKANLGKTPVKANILSEKNPAAYSRIKEDMKKAKMRKF